MRFTQTGFSIKRERTRYAMDPGDKHWHGTIMCRVTP
jgi:hypothetical protein